VGSGGVSGGRSYWPEDEANAFSFEAAGLALAVGLEQYMGLEFTKVIAKLGEGVALAVRSKSVGGEDGLMDLRQRQPVSCMPRLSRTSLRRNMWVSWILITRILLLLEEMGKGRKLLRK